MRTWLSEDWRTCCSSTRLSGPINSSPPASTTFSHGVSANRQLRLGNLFTECQQQRCVICTYNVHRRVRRDVFKG